MVAREDDLELATAIADFLLLFRTDQERGSLQSLAHYEARFPGFVDEIAREYEALLAERSSRAPSGLSARGFRVIDELGRGGQGTVYLAEDLELGRLVALKTLYAPLGSYSKSRLARLQRETAVLASIDHPSICAIYRAYLEDDPPFLVMRYVRGRTLAQLLAAQRSGFPNADPLRLQCPPRSRAELATLLEFFERAAQALHVAHRAGIVHRDIKPANLVVTPEGEPVLLDFGLARTLVNDEHGLTRTGEILGSPAYMSPEQFDGIAGEADPRTDIYSLGIALFECLTGRRPFEAHSQHHLERAIRFEPLPRPSKLNPFSSVDLDVVLAAATEKSRAKRYSTALDLAEDLRRVRELRPIRARPTGRALRLRRWCQRNPSVATALGLTGLAALGLLVATLLLWREQARTQGALLVAESRNLAANALRNLELDPLVALREAIQAHSMSPGVHSRSALYSAISRQWVVRVYDQYVEGDPVHFEQSAITPNGRRWLAVGRGGPLALYDASGREPIRLWPACRPTAMAVDPRGEYAAIGTTACAVRWFDVTRGENRVLSAHRGAVRALTFAASGELASGGADGIVRLYSASPRCEWTGDVQLPFVIGGLRFSPTGSWLLAWPGETRERVADTSPVVIDVGSQRIVAVLAGHTQRIDEVAFSSAGSVLATASDDRTVRIWDLPTGTCRLVVPHPGKLHDVAFSPDDQHLITGFDPGPPGSSEANGAWVISVLEGKKLLDLRGHESRAVSAVDWSSDGSRLLTGSYDSTVRIWSASDGRPLACLRTLFGLIFDARFLDGGGILVRKGMETLVAHADLRAPTVFLAGHEAAVQHAGFSRDGNLLASADRDGWVLVHDVDTGALLSRLRVEAASEVAFVGEGTSLLVAVGDGAVRRFRVPSGSLDMEVHLGTEPARLLRPCKSSENFVVSCGARIVRCDLRGNVLREFVGHQSPVSCLDLSADERFLASGAADRSARIWDLESGACEQVLTDWSVGRARPGLSEDFSVRFDPHGTKLVRVSDDSYVRCYSIPAGRLLWECLTTRFGDAQWVSEDSLLFRPKWSSGVSMIQVQRGVPLLESMSPTPTGLTMAMAVSPDRRLGAVVATSGRTMIWNLTDRSLWADFGAGPAVLFAVFSPDGSSLVTTQADGTVNLWPMDVEQAARQASPSIVHVPEDFPGSRAR